MSNQWARLAVLFRDLYTKPRDHLAMVPNIDKTYDTPADNKHLVYFMWDFIGGTLHLLKLVPARIERLRGKQNENWEDVKGMATYGSSLILDDPKGPLERMVRSAPHDQVDFMPAMEVELEVAARAVLGTD